MNDLPLIRLDPKQTGFWYLNTGIRQLVANVFFKKYGPCVVLSAELYAIAVVELGARLRLLEFPYRRFEMWQITNKPEPADCYCRQYFDMEVQGAWSERDLNRHHPMCIYKQTAQSVFDAATRRGVERPDLWMRLENDLVGQSKITTAGH